MVVAQNVSYFLTVTVTPRNACTNFKLIYIFVIVITSYYHRPPKCLYFVFGLGIVLHKNYFR
jgi:hypothetical protein